MFSNYLLILYIAIFPISLEHYIVGTQKNAQKIRKCGLFSNLIGGGIIEHRFCEVPKGVEYQMFGRTLSF